VLWAFDVCHHGGRNCAQQAIGEQTVDARTGLVIGGMTAVAASVAVVCAVAMTNTAALKDAPATTVTTSRILVPAAASSPSATPTPAPTATTPPTTTLPDTPTEAEVVEAPDPTEVEPAAPNTDTPPSTPAASAAAPAAPETPATPETPAVDEGVDAAIDAARAAGTWGSLRAWAEAHGWATERIDALIERLERAASTDRVTVGADLPEQGTVQKKSHADHPAHAGSNGNGHDAVPDRKKDQSRYSPDKRD